MTALNATLPREFLLAAACCIWPPSERRNLAICSALEEKIDWDRFLRIVKRQRVAGLVHDGLTQAQVSVPPHIARQTQNMAAGIARQNLFYAAESLRIQQLFDEAGVSLLFVKGITLAQLAYGTLALKHSWDVDLLVMPGAVSQALQLLAQAGYHPFPALPPTKDQRYERWMRFGNEFVLFHNSNSVHVELHWKLAENSYFLSEVSAESPTQIVRLPNGAGLRTLVDDDLFAYLCVHGASHGWSRLKWLADVAALMVHDNASDAQQRLNAAKTVRAEECVAQAFLLCDRLFATPSLIALSLQLRLKRRCRWLERVAFGALTNGGAETETDHSSLVHLSIRLSHFMLGRGLRFASNELWNKLNRPYDQLYITLPNWLGILYPLVRIAAWVKRRGRPRPLPVPPNLTPE